MAKKLLFILSFLLPTMATAQGSLKQYEGNFAGMETLNDYNPSFKVEVRDLRTFEHGRVAIQNFTDYLRGFMELQHESSFVDPVNLTQLQPKKVTVDLEFFNFIESSSKKAILKAIASVHLSGGGYSNIETDFNISAEEFTSMRFKNITNKKNLEEIEAVLEEFSKRFARKIVDRINEELRNEVHGVFEVSAIGTTLHEGDEEESKKKAVMAALIKASEKAFGVNISNYAEMVDYGDVTDKIFSETGGTVLYHVVDPGSVRLTDDGYYCLIVKSIIKRK